MLAALIKPSGSTAPLSAENNKFTAEFFKLACAAAKPDENVFLSPYNILTALSMLLIGTGGSSETQLAKALSLEAPVSSTLKKNLKAFVSAVRSSSEGATVRTATSTWLHKDLQLTSSYKDDLKTIFETENTIVDFTDASKATKTINDWVAKCTENLIKSLLAPGIITKYTRLVLVSAIYFRGKWASQFKKSDTKKRDFTLLDGKTKQSVNMMTQTESFPNGSVLDCAGLVLPYLGEQMSMIVLLPKGDSSQINDMASNTNLFSMAASSYKAWPSQKTRVMLPRFEMGHEMDACETMKQLGATDLFEAESLDLSKMIKSRSDGISVTAIAHKAFVSVDEEGTKAAAATAVVMSRFGGPPTINEFIVDRPFFFLIVHGTTILFVGKCLSIDKK